MQGQGQGGFAMPDFDADDQDDGYGRHPGSVAPQANVPLGPVMSPDDPRYGRPAPIYSERPVYNQQQPMPNAAGGAPNVNYGYSDGLRPPGAVGGQPAMDPRGGQPTQLAALPPEEQPELNPAELPPHLRKQEVDFASKEPAGTIVVDTANTYLYYILGNGRAMRYGVRVGRDGFTWTGVQKVSRKAEWPDWHPPAEMIERQPYLPRFMAGGPGNPMGARAMYLGSTVYRIHGTNQPSTIGKFVSSGCIGMLNEDVEDLFERVKVGSRVVVLPGKPPAAAAQAGAAAAPMPAPGPAMSSNPPVPQGNIPQGNAGYSAQNTLPPLPQPVTIR